MRTILIAAGSMLVLSAAASAQDGAPAAPQTACYIEIHRLMAEPPAGIGELGAAIRDLDVRLRPQIEEIKVLKAQIARLERQAQAGPRIEEVSLDYEDTALARPVADDRVADEVMRLQAELGGKQDQLKLDYAAQQQALVGPVEARISRGAQAFSASSGCSEVRMARKAELPALTGAGARDVTGEFVTWYLAHPPG